MTTADADTDALRSTDPVEQIVRFSRTMPLPLCLAFAAAAHPNVDDENREVDARFAEAVGCAPAAMRCVDVQRLRMKERYTREVAEHVSKFWLVEARRGRFVREAVRAARRWLAERERAREVVAHLEAAHGMTRGGGGSSLTSMLPSVLSAARIEEAGARAALSSSLKPLRRLKHCGQFDRVLTDMEKAEVDAMFMFE